MLRGIGLCVVLCVTAAAQQRPVFRAETTLMEVEVRVTGKDGRSAPDLTKEDFRLTENGVEQVIASCEFIRAPGEAAPVPAAEELTIGGRNYPSGAFERLRRSTLIYIWSQARREDQAVIQRTIREFIEEKLQPGVLISLDGTPFTSDRAKLLKALAARGSSYDEQTIVEERESEYAAEFEELVEDLNSRFTALVEEGTSRRAYLNYIRLYRYIDLARALGIFPGRKIVVMFGTGFHVEDENLDLLNVFANEALRARVKFFVADASRLRALAPGGNATERGDFRSLTGDPSRRGFRGIEKLQDQQDGLRELARLSGGKAVFNTNRLGELFEKVNEELSGYYLLSYYPRLEEQRGRFRRIRVTVNGRDLKVEHLRGYYEGQEYARLSNAQRDLQLYQAVEFDTPYTDIPLTVGFETFQGADGQPVLAYSVGIHFSKLPVKSTGKGVEMDFTVVARAAAAGEPVLDDGRLRMALRPEHYERLEGSRSAMLHYTSQMQLPPGRYHWRVVLRDEHTGQIGSYRTEVAVPDFRQAQSPSSLLLTGYVAPAPAGGAGALDAGGRRFFPDAARVFGRGDPIYLLYDLYNIGEAQAAKPPSAKLALYHDKTPVKELPVRRYSVENPPGSRRLRYLAEFDTGSLEPGDYVMLAMLPPRDGGAAAVIYRRFKIVPQARVTAADLPAGGLRREPGGPGRPALVPGAFGGRPGRTRP